ncbi:hypothetical protein D9M68_622300 [compost metagenome]
MVPFHRVEEAQVEVARHVEFQCGAQQQLALACREIGVLVVQLEPAAEGDFLHRAEGEGTVEDTAEVQLVTIDKVGLDRARVAVLLRVVAVGLEDVEIEEVLAMGITAGMAELIDLLLDLLRHRRFGEVLAVAEADEGVAPVHGLDARGHAKRASDQYLAKALL